MKVLLLATSSANRFVADISWAPSNAPRVFEVHLLSRDYLSGKKGTLEPNRL